MRKYDSYKESEIEYISEIPIHWKVKPLYTLFNEVKDKNKGNLESNVLSLSYGNIKKRNIESNMGLLPDSFETYNRIKKDDIVLRLTDLQNDKKSLRTGLVREKGIITSAYVTLRKRNENINAEYAHWLLHAFDVKKVFYNLGAGVRQSMGYSELKKMNLILPPRTEQKKIVDYLQHKISDIDKLVENLNVLINKLEQQRQSIITEAVTKGLNPNVKMKDSGVEWIGEIPEHWEEKKIKYLFYEANERNFNEDATLLSLFTSIGVKPRKEMEQKGNKAQTVINYKIVRKKDIVVNKLLAWMGAIGLSEYNGVTSPDYDVYRPLNTEKVEELYYHYYFRNHYFKGDCFKFGRGIMMMRWRTYPEQLKSILVPVPPKEEQIQIANYIEYKEKELAQTIKNIEKSIEKLKEYRQSLIYEAVTGKIDVRDMELD